jgi:hypothetical protein
MGRPIRTISACRNRPTVLEQISQRQEYQTKSAKAPFDSLGNLTND